MALIEHTLLGKVDKVKTAIERIKTYDPIRNGYMDKPYYVAYSGGKDSDALRILFELAGVQYDLVHNHTTVDAPETVHYVRSIPNIQISMPKYTMWQLIVKKHIPPTRRIRYCCQILKEQGGRDRFVATGVRWAESSKRKKTRNSLEIQRSNIKNTIYLNADNDESRRLFETCTLKGKRVINPIIDWSEEDVWELLRYYGCNSNPLYACGFKRIGCIGCPMAGPNRQLKEFEMYPKYLNLYLRTFDRMIQKRIDDCLPVRLWKNGIDVFCWWLNLKPHNKEVPQLMSKCGYKYGTD